MPTYHVVIPTDFSPGSENAIAWARQFLKGKEAQVTFLHVFEFVGYYAPWTVGLEQTYFTYQGVEKIQPEFQEEIDAKLKQFCRDFESDGFRANSITIWGKSFHQIIEFAQKEKADLLILGSSGRGMIEHALIGSVAEKVVRHAPCPTLVVPFKTQK